MGADEKAIELEQKIFAEIVKVISENAASLKITSNAIASLDTLISFAEVALENNYCKPTINEKIEGISIVKGRHPVVEKIIGLNNFVANDLNVDRQDNRTMIITGPNMAGKSTYMRSVAIITLLAHIGCFVPASEAQISITDRIFTRIGASDDLAFGQSTFMVEMTEVATILNNATDKSLLILDEIGRGTSTCDGLAIAWAVIEYITNNFKTKTLFSTHYHGIPQSVLDRANTISKKLEQNEIVKDTNSILLDSKEIFEKDDIKQLSFFQNSLNDEIIDRLKEIDTDNMTPLQALRELSDLKEKVRKIK